MTCLEESSTETECRPSDLGDLVIAAFFEESTANAREARRKELADAVLTGHTTDQYHSWLEELRQEDPPLGTLSLANRVP